MVTYGSLVPVHQKGTTPSRQILFFSELNPYLASEGIDISFTLKNIKKYAPTALFLNTGNIQLCNL